MSDAGQAKNESSLGDTVESSEKTARRRPTGLGRGLSALMGDNLREEPLVSRETSDRPDGPGSRARSPEGLKSLPLAHIEPHPEQPRRHFSDEALDELARSISRRGVIQPVVVRPLPNGRFQLVAGERRWRASQRARLHEIPAIVRDLSEEDTLTLALVENIQREDLNPVEEAQAYKRLADLKDCTQAEIAKMVDKSRSHVANLMRLLSLPASVLEMVATNRLSMGHARTLIGSEDAEQLAAEIIDRNLSVRDTEKLVRQRGQGGSDSAAERSRSIAAGGVSSNNADIAAVERHLEDLLGLKVQILAKGDGK
jgi:ParB family transcriptional regulator, chromosome partitioning protein